MRIAFIGGGNMSSALIGGLLARGVAADDLSVADPSVAQLERLRREFGLKTTADNVEAVRGSDLVVLAVKPQDMARAAGSLAAELAARRRVVVSVAAGIRLESLAQSLGGASPLVRAMPNRPALIGAGVTAAYSSPGVTPGERTAVEAVLSAVGPLVWLEEEEQLDAVTAVSGSGPAYFFLLVEALEDAGAALGLPRATARQLAVHTALGAGRMAAESAEPPAVLREQVTSKGGTTAAALAVLEAADIRGLVQRAVAAAAHRSAQLAREFGTG
jgi:pyrroline-5-carboxylate reductase